MKADTSRLDFPASSPISCFSLSSVYSIGHAYRTAEAVEAKKAKATEKRAKDAEEKAISKAREAEIVQQLEEAGLSDDELDEDETDMELKR